MFTVSCFVVELYEEFTAVGTGVSAILVKLNPNENKPVITIAMRALGSFNKVLQKL
jgi:hypothetical protein